MSLVDFSATLDVLRTVHSERGLLGLTLRFGCECEVVVHQLTPGWEHKADSEVMSLVDISMDAG